MYVICDRYFKGSYINKIFTGGWIIPPAGDANIPGNSGSTQLTHITFKSFYRVNEGIFRN